MCTPAEVLTSRNLGRIRYWSSARSLVRITLLLMAATATAGTTNTWQRKFCKFPPHLLFNASEGEAREEEARTTVPGY